MATLDIVCLRSLITVASLAGVRRAAEALHLSQPTVSGHLRRLEHELGSPIVFRQGRSIAFTSLGEDLLREAYVLVAAHDAAVSRVAGGRGDELIVASTQHASEPMLREIGDLLRIEFPGRTIRYEFHRTARLREFVHRRAAAVAIGFGDLGAGVEHVADVPLSWVGADHADDAAPGLVAFAAPCVIRDRMLTATRSRTIDRECIDLVSLLQAVRSGAGITALPARSRLGAGLRRIDAAPHLDPVPLTFVTGPGIPARLRSRIRRELRRVWADPTGR
jgi:DNA-binding transcriptional LysR family regulator